MSDFGSGRAASGPSGIGGWLILPIIGFVATILLTGHNLWTSLKTFDGLKAIFAATSGPLTGLKIPVTLSFVSGCLLIITAAWCLYFIFAKKRAIVRFATAHYLIWAVAGPIEIWGGLALEKAIPGNPLDPSVVTGAVRGILTACIWIPYFRRSKRVRNTFSGSGANAPDPHG
jgi:Protein of unknown function (DUF2569)